MPWTRRRFLAATRSAWKTPALSEASGIKEIELRRTGWRPEVGGGA